ncbi:MAG TPA: hypothetical protein VIB07_00745 [Nitrososphaera sp.]|jgi:hypothetical protein
MGKLIRRTDGSLELDVSDAVTLDLLKELFASHIRSLSSASLEDTMKSSATTASSSSDESLPDNLAHRYSTDKWNFIGKAYGERKGITTHNIFFLFQHKATHVLIGVERSKKRDRISHLGNPSDTTSIISQIRHHIETLPFNQDFPRRTLVQLLPSKLARTELLKYAFVYFKHIGMIKESGRKDFGTGARTYVRVKEITDSARRESVHEAAGAITVGASRTGRDS